MNNRKTVWITGASSGIGEALAMEWARKGANLILSSRSEGALKTVAARCENIGAQALVQTIDLANNQEIIQACQKVLSSFDRLDYIFLNGGLSQRSYIEDTPLEMDRKMMEINYFGNVSIVKELLPRLIKQGGSHFVVTSSLTGVFGIGLRSSYAASKHALHGFFDTLRAEQHKNNIAVTIACPGFIKTEISVHALGPDGKPTGKMDDAQDGGMTASTCAKKMISAALNGKKEVYIGRKEVLMVYFKRYLPFIYYFLASRVKPN